MALAAHQESRAIFTHFNTGYHFEDVDRLEPMHGLRQCEPFVRAVRRRVGGFIGVQAMPVPRRMFHEYDALIEAGADHFSFCYEFEDPEVFARLCPGKQATLGQRGFFEAMEYTVASSDADESRERSSRGSSRSRRPSAGSTGSSRPAPSRRSASSVRPSEAIWRTRSRPTPRR